MKVMLHLLIFFIFSMVHVVEPQLAQAQPCLVCGNAVLRLWSFMSREGDRYLRITSANDNRNNNHKIVDCGGGLQRDNFTSLLKIRERSTFGETRIQLVMTRSNRQYHMYATSISGQVLAMPASEGEQQTDNRNTWAPERLLYEHRLFTVFQSVKFRGYYLSCDGSGQAVLRRIINKAHREPNQLFITIDPGNKIEGVAFGSGNVAARKKRGITSKRSYNHGYRGSYVQRKKYTFFQSHKNKLHQTNRPKPRPYLWHTTKRPVTTKPPVKQSSVMTNFSLPLKITFVLCFWIKTESNFAQLISVTENKPKKEPDYDPYYYYFPHSRRTFYRPWKQKKPQKKDTENNIINVSIFERNLRLQLGYKRIQKTLKNCDITDGSFHQICISLNHQYQLEVYRDSEVVFNQSFPSLANDFENRNNLNSRQGTLTLGMTKNMSGKRFEGSLFQVNLWDQYPSFRIKRIATNCGCGGGNLVEWNDLLNGTMSDVSSDTQSECPKLEGYNYDEITQNRLI